MEKYSLFIYESLKKTKCREFVPSRDEIEALIHRQEMTSMVYCHGGGSCKITINSHTTAGEVRKRPLSRTLCTVKPAFVPSCGWHGHLLSKHGNKCALRSAHVSKEIKICIKYE